MSIEEAVRSVLSQYATFSGRARRSEFWLWILATAIAGLLVGVADNLLRDVLGFGNKQPLSAIYSLAILVPGLAVAVRRLHDTDRSGWWLLLTLIPILGQLALIWFWTRPGTAGPNRFG